MSRVRLYKISTPTTPATNAVEIFYDTSDGKIKQINDAGVVTVLSNLPNTLYVATDGSTVTFDFDANGTLQIVTLGGNRTLAFTITANKTFSITLKQDATGSRTVTWPTGISWAGGTAPTLTPTAAKSDTFVFIRTGSGAYLGFVAGQNN